MERSTVTDRARVSAAIDAAAEEAAPRSRALEAYELLRHAILSGELPAGRPTPQIALSETLGVGRTPLREALKMLQKEGLIERDPHRQVRIRPLSVTEIEQLYALRVVNESFALRAGLPTMTDEQLGELRAAVDELDELAEARDLAAWEPRHREFHRALTAAAGEKSEQLTTELADHSRRYRQGILIMDPISWARGAQAHRQIVEACCARDARTASCELAEHLAKTALGLIAQAAPAYDPRLVREALRFVMGAGSDVSARGRGFATRVP